MTEMGMLEGRALEEHKKAALEKLDGVVKYVEFLLTKGSLSKSIDEAGVLQITADYALDSSVNQTRDMMFREFSINPLYKEVEYTENGVIATLAEPIAEVRQIQVSIEKMK